MQKYDLLVVGGGASGLVAAIAAKETLGAMGSVAVLESQGRVGRKLMATGNGRCNYTNLEADISHYYGTIPAFAAVALQRFSAVKNMDFFAELGIYPRVEAGGRVYPFSGQASSFVDALRFKCEALGVLTLTDCPVKALKKSGDAFTLTTDQGTFESEKVILATGGMASPDLGGNPSGYDLAAACGHGIIEIYPVLVPLKTEKELPKALQGLKFQGRATLRKGQKRLIATEGEILFTAYGLSGPGIFDLSCGLPRRDIEDLWIDLDFFPTFDEGELREMLISRRDNLTYLTLEFYLSGLLHKKIGQLLLKRVLGRKLSEAVTALSDEDIAVLSRKLKAVSLSCYGAAGWKGSQVTAGGVSLGEVTDATMESKLTEGLYLAGEILDIFGDCGGFNLQWAWSSGRLAGESAGKALKAFLC